MTVLAWDVPSRLGVFPAGLQVRVLQRSRYRVKVYLDPPGVHLTARCHSAYLTPDTLRQEDHGTHTPGEPASLSAGLAADHPAAQGSGWLAL